MAQKEKSGRIKNRLKEKHATEGKVGRILAHASHGKKRKSEFFANCDFWAMS